MSQTFNTTNVLNYFAVSDARFSSANMNGISTSFIAEATVFTPSKPQSYLRFIRPKKSTDDYETGEVPANWAVVCPYFRCGRVIPHYQIEAETLLIDDYAVYTTINNTFTPYVLDNCIRFRPGIIEVFGRQIKWDDSDYIAKGSDFGSGGYIYVYIVVDLTNSLAQKAYFYTSQSSTLTKRDNLIEKEGGFARVKIAAFSYDLNTSTLALLDPKTVGVPIPFTGIGIMSMTMESVYYNGLSESEFIDDDTFKWADTAGIGITDSRLISNKNAFCALYSSFYTLAIGNHITYKNPIGGANGNDNPYFKITASNLIGFRIVFERSGGSDYVLRIRERLRPSANSEYQTLAEILINDFDRKIWLTNGKKDITLNWYLVTGREYSSAADNTAQVPMKEAMMMNVESSNQYAYPNNVFDLFDSQSDDYDSSDGRYSHDLLAFLNVVPMPHQLFAFKMFSIQILYDSYSDSYVLGNTKRYGFQTVNGNTGATDAILVPDVRAGKIEHSKWVDEDDDEASKVRFLVEPIYKSIGG
jgi:hypothetical protein